MAGIGCIVEALISPTTSLSHKYPPHPMGPSSESNPRKKKIGGMDFEDLSRHGYHGGPSILKVPPPRVEEKDQDWSWSTGERRSKEEEAKESYEERERTRAISQGEKILNLQTINSPFEKKEKSKSFSQKEKRKRDIGQASRGKNYVEEEKRLLRDSGLYSGFDV
ncbi:uncharacterized protein LOC109835433 isoform X2 [Asparagus officinalis]|uniref:uncharacterized protein LOC109835433 isoform X2 n=1 Tax=Asparagus officinalis TaxID=4686 RepID=UPI00098E3EEA|nr:uncharacterized protein LOC109835433 isoform X2 [Asparagus officinalis]XP_020259000.1 uncharacterized protein LOC109835433 isoform X2 [Asparagus officinalis]